MTDVYRRRAVVNARNSARRRGLDLKASCKRDPGAIAYGTYWLVDADSRELHWPTNTRYGASLEEVQSYLQAFRPVREPHAR